MPTSEEENDAKSVPEQDSAVKPEDKAGLTSAEAAERLKKYGPNAIEEKEETWLHRLFRRFWGPIPWMIEIAAILSAMVKHWEDFTIITILLLVNAVVDFYQESKALSALKVLKNKLARKALVLRDGSWQQIDAKEIVPGDIVKIRIGDIVPADVKLLPGGDFLQVDQSALTGESLPVTRKTDDTVYANAIVKKGESVAEVVETGENTYFGKTVKLVAKAESEEHSHFQEMVVKVGNFLIAVTLVMVSIIIYFGISRGQSVLDLLEYALILTVAAIPVALPAVLTVTMAAGAKLLANMQAIVSRLSAIEELAGMDVLCSDKTGTLTQNKMTINNPYTVGDIKEEDIIFYAALASKEENQDPIETPIYNYLKSHNLYNDLKAYALEKFTPFDPVSKRTESVLIKDKKTIQVSKGAPQVIIEMCDEKAFDKKEAYAKVESFAEKGFRTLGVAWKDVTEETWHFMGLVPLYDPPREDSKAVIADAKEHGVSVKMVTGDNVAVAKYIAGVLDIGPDIRDIKALKGESTEEYVFLAEVLAEALYKKLEPEKVSEESVKKFGEDISKEVQKLLLDRPLPKGSIKQHESEIVEAIEQANGFAQVFPEDKYFIVDKLQKADRIVGMTGDGVNDAPALKKADCGIAVSGATDAARASADLVLLAPGLNVINNAIKIARITFERMQSYTIYRITETIRVILLFTLTISIFNFYPITTVEIILLALFNDLPILAIAYDNTKLRKYPVRWDMKEVLVLSTWLGIAGVMSSFLLFWLVYYVWQINAELTQTIFFAKLIIAGHGTLYNTRRDDWFFKRPWPNPILWNASLWSAVVAVVIAVYGFGLIYPMGWGWAIFLVVYLFVWFLFNDAVKMLVLGYYRKRGKLDI
ncbi:plasma-membrane proton-efflux P-type ATPase [Sulfurovum sp.]|uniref:plasma-membrane proton-efflux P-type ATPase n=1 Tax=Sulfurovum sp. TaxID=1969726 RepID=UPI0025E55788|nr:plasma-membrane proton-efflux P-type ATPase [Sulfurovum sp.]